MSETAAASEPKLPRSATNHGLALLSLAGGLGVAVLFKLSGSQNAGLCLPLMILAIAMPHIPGGLRAGRSNLMGAGPVEEQTRAAERLFLKLLGLAATFAILALAYFVFTGYTNPFVQPVLRQWPGIWVPLLLMAPVYIWYVDRSMRDPDDGLYHFGLFVAGRGGEADSQHIKQYALSWLVKGFFGPMMITFMLGDLKWFLGTDFLALIAKPNGYYIISYKSLFLVDVMFAVTGYLLTLKLLDSHIRSSDPTVFGWLACLSCYAPFNRVILDNLLDYQDDYFWGHMLQGQFALWVLWGMTIIALLTVYSWASVAFGIKFSNMTNRGVITNGPYRWLKHPAYVSKNLSWWLIAVPFISAAGPAEALRNCLALLGINLLYYWRAKTEERHLMSDPDYRDYSAWIDRHGLAAMIRQRLSAKPRREA